MNRSRTLVPLVIFALALAIVALFWAVPRAYADEAAPPPAVTATERPDYCPDAPAPCAGFEDEYIDNGKPEDIPPADTGVNPDTGRPYYCPDIPAPCAGFEDEYIDNGKPEATPEPTQAPAPAPKPTQAPGLPKAGV